MNYKVDIYNDAWETIAYYYNFEYAMIDAEKYYGVVCDARTDEIIFNAMEEN